MNKNAPIQNVARYDKSSMGLTSFLFNNNLFTYFGTWNKCHVVTNMYYRTRANKERGFYSKIMFLAMHNGTFH